MSSRTLRRVDLQRTSYRRVVVLVGTLTLAFPISTGRAQQATPPATTTRAATTTATAASELFDPDHGRAVYGGLKVRF